MSDSATTIIDGPSCTKSQRKRFVSHKKDELRNRLGATAQPCKSWPCEAIQHSKFAVNAKETTPLSRSELSVWSALHIPGKPPLQAPTIPKRNLTRAQRKVFKLLRRGLCDKEVAKQLGISVHRIHHRIRKIYRAFQVESCQRISLNSYVPVPAPPRQPRRAASRPRRVTGELTSSGSQMDVAR